MQTGALSGQQRFDLILVANLSAFALVVPAIVLLPIGNDFPELLFLIMAFSSLVGCTFGVREQVKGLTGSGNVRASDLPWPRIRMYALNMWLTGLLGSLSALSQVMIEGLEFPIEDREDVVLHACGVITAKLYLKAKVRRR